jgi:hypothetical protein
MARSSCAKWLPQKRPIPTAYDDLALEALRAYEMRAPTLTILEHNDSITYCVAADDEQYLLRFHLHVSAEFAGRRQGLRAIASELLWLDALGRETNLTLQLPAQGLIGRLVIKVESADERIPCLLLTWVEGHPFLRRPSASVVATLGALIARLHQQARAPGRRQPALRVRSTTPFTLNATTNGYQPRSAIVACPAGAIGLDGGATVGLALVSKAGDGFTRWEVVAGGDGAGAVYANCITFV